MKSAKPPAAESSGNRRSQPVRQTRTNPPRTSATAAARQPSGKQSLGSAPTGDQPIDIFPAITHFADAITALPKELVRHFTLLKEVDAKVFAPEEQLFRLVSAAANAPLPESRPNNDASSSIASVSGAVAGADGTVAPQVGTSVHSAALTDDTHAASTVFDPSNIPRRQLFRQTAFKIQEMLVSLEEKNHVINTANEALQRQLARVEDVWPYIENEFSDEAKWGSTTHWAYPENRLSKTSHAERARRDGAAVISAAAQALVDEAAARSDARKQAVQAKKSLKNSHQDSDFDEHGGRNKAEGGKKSHHSKVRKTAEGGVGLGISTSSSSAAGNPPQKRRKVEKETGGPAAADRAMSAALGGTAKAKTNSPRGTPAPEGQKKRKALPSASSQPKKSRNGVTGKSTSVTSSPVLGTLPEPKTGARASPAPGNAARPASSRARQNSIQSVADSVKLRPSSATSNKPNGKTTAANTEANPSSNWPKPSSESTPGREPSVPTKTEPNQKEPETTERSATPAAKQDTKKDSKPDETDRKSESVTPLPQTTSSTVTTKSGRASKPSTPALSTFEEAAAARSRPSRNSSNGTSHKKQHQKKGSTASQVLVAPPIPEEERGASMPGEEDEDGDIDADEPRYCYCNGVSYGEMVACDSDDCEREWFHLACVGLRTAPGSKTKWYCEDCKERLKSGGKKINGR